MWNRDIVLVKTAVSCVHSTYISVGEITWVLKDRRVTKRISGIKISITHFHRFVEFETPHPECWRAMVAHKESTLEVTVVEGCVFHELTFSSKMPNAVAAESMQISIQVGRSTPEHLHSICMNEEIILLFMVS